MQFQQVILLIVVVIFTVEAKSRGRPLMGADEAPAMRPTCRPDGENNKRVPCPSPDSDGKWACVKYDDLCNDTYDCPNGEDEEGTMCWFHIQRNNRMRALEQAIQALRQ